MGNEIVEEVVVCVLIGFFDNVLIKDYCDLYNECKGYYFCGLLVFGIVGKYGLLNVDSGILVFKVVCLEIFLLDLMVFS